MLRRPARPIFGVVDWVQNLTSMKPELYGIPVYYHRCGNAGICSPSSLMSSPTRTFPEWVYNEQYGLVDLGYGEIRATQNAKLISENFPDAKPFNVLDYGGGNGKLAELLREKGFGSVDSYDPFVTGFTTRPERV